MGFVSEIFSLTLIFLISVRMIKDHTLLFQSWESSYLSILAFCAAIVVLLSFIVTRAAMILRRIFSK